MQKLEEVLKAEEAARHLVAEARERGSAIVKDAEKQASELRSQQRAGTSAQAASIVAEAATAARTQAEQIRSSSERDLEAELARAGQRMTAAVQRAITELAG